MPQYKAHIRRWKGEQIQRIVIGVSVGNQDYEGKKLEALVNYLNLLSPREVIVEVCDTLQRWSDLTLDEEKARKNGDKWIERNKGILERLTSSLKITRWDKWLKSSNFKNVIQKVNELYNENQEFKQSILETAEQVGDQFEKRHQVGSGNEDTNKEIFKQNSTKYLLEEIAVIMLLWTAETDQLDLFYPNKMTEALATGHKFLVENSKEEKRQLNWHEIRFTKVAENDNVISKGKVLISDNKGKSVNKNNGKSASSPAPTVRFFPSSNPKLDEGDELIENLSLFKKNLKTVQKLLAAEEDNNLSPKLINLRKQLMSSDILSDIQIIHDLLSNDTKYKNKNSILSY